MSEESKEPKPQLWLPNTINTIKVWVKGDDVRMDGNTIEFEYRRAQEPGFRP